ncbi:MAG: adenylate/guanylate cyclase domain-containing protein [Pseudanabaena sp. M135S2SP2A07QC]|nr:adenylate/guanylate cyclase domain-containing protein [Pseudanabaena sp. M179S2SP2A07QC]MCA6528795.1 adenylate/guanylate cyclase domain-containing protein [Pseudanabaena sp. M125S2SP2A07QC]MCA6536751.1 adenylate/guanylate cyclase domain-containing protein [Pseudanabaena sp. M176S2SP2A07QC]MCA6539355.1 adenylate/guanylate cyclase domain-containing protein [Pseudanabaena sp. M037S2SP2A07QC]MCA6543535.1 adenylate/guanylate cyclase domain-containing protein [Pseudanabaena sp. M074S1SP2A07QC]MCA
MQWFKFNWLSIKSKLIVMLLTVSSSSILVTAYLGYQSGKSNLTDRVFNQLTSVRASKAYQIESYFKTIRNHIQTLSIDPSVGTALSEFTNAYRQLENVPLPADALPKINAYYQNEFLPKLAQTEQGSPVLNSFLPEAIASNYLQYHYIANNSNPIGKKHLLDKANDSSEYSRLHGRYHPIFRNIIEKFGYYDLFLIDPDGRIVYTVYKETDFASSLTIGAYNESNLARLFASVRRSKEKDYARIIDLESYAPSYGAPAAFIAAPIYNQDKFIGVLAIQVPVDEINNVMTGNRKWEADGLGKSGETYLVGPDYLMRSVSRFLIETPEEYLKTLVALGVNNETIKRIRQYKTSVLAQAVKTTAVEEAMMGKQDIKIIRDYRDIPVLSSYSLLQIEGLKWAILSEIDLAEAYAPIYDFERQLVISATLLMLLVILLAMVMASLFVKPINQLITSARKVAAGQLDAIAVLETEDEFGELAQSFNLMVSSLRDQTDLVEEKNRENEQLLLSIFPAAIAKRLKQGEKNIAESASNVTVLFSDLTGFSKLSDSLTAYEIVSILNDLVTSFDETADRFGMEKIKTIGDSYMAVCGLSVPYLDHDKRAIDFAIEMQAIVRRFSQERGFKLNISLGINSGDIVAGIVGRNKFIYDVWGDTINIASALKSACPEGAILVSHEIYNRLCDLYEFAPLATKIEDGEVVLEAWHLKSTIKIKPS